MKKLFLMGLLTSATLANAASVEINTTAMVDAHHITCVQVVGSTYQYAQIENEDHSVILAAVQDDAILLKHQKVTVEGCDLPRLEKIKHRADMGFGFLHNVPVKVKKEESAPYRDGAGECKSLYIEYVDVNFDEGIVMSSRAMKEQPAQGCH